MSTRSDGRMTYYKSRAKHCICHFCQHKKEYVDNKDFAYIILLLACFLVLFPTVVYILLRFAKP